MTIDKKAIEKFLKNKKNRLMIQIISIPLILLIAYSMVVSSLNRSAEKYKLNKALDQLASLSNAIHQNYATQEDYKGLDNYSLQANAIVPSDMQGKNNNIIHAYNGDVVTRSIPLHHSKDGAFVIIYNGLNQEACVSLLASIPSAGGLAGIDVAPIYAETHKTAKPRVEAKALPFPQEQAKLLCEAQTDPTNAIIWIFY